MFKKNLRKNNNKQRKTQTKNGYIKMIKMVKFVPQMIV